MNQQPFRPVVAATVTKSGNRRSSAFFTFGSDGCYWSNGRKRGDGCYWRTGATPVITIQLRCSTGKCVSSVVNSGTAEARALCLKIPRGQQGYEWPQIATILNWFDLGVLADSIEKSFTNLPRAELLRAYVVH